MLSLSIGGKIERSIAPKVTLGDREERFTLERAGKVTLRILIHGNHWSPVVHGDRINRLLLTTR